MTSIWDNLNSKLDEALHLAHAEDLADSTDGLVKGEDPIAKAEREKKLLKRVALVDPNLVAYYGGAGFGPYKPRFSHISFKTLKEMSLRDPIVATIFQTRINQISTFARPQANRYDTGFKIFPKDAGLEIEPDSQEEQEVKFLTDFIMNTGIMDENRDPKDYMNFETWLKLVTRDNLTFGAAAIETIRDQRERLYAFLPVPTETVFYANKSVSDELVQSLAEGNKSSFFNGAEKEQKQEDYDQRIERLKDGEYEFVQVIEGRIVEGFSDQELIYSLGYPNNFIDSNGYCYVPGTLVLMADGTSKVIEDIKIGDSLINHLGQTVSVEKTTRRSVHEDILRFRIGGYTPFSATKNHPIYAVNDPMFRFKVGEIKPSFIAAEDLVKGSYLVVPKIKSLEKTYTVDLCGIREYRHPNGIERALLGKDTIRAWAPTSRWHDRYINIDEDLAWLVGLYAGDGCIHSGNGHKVRIDLSNHESWVWERIEKIAHKYGWFYKRSCASKSAGEYTNVYIGDSVVADLFSYLVPGKALTKHFISPLLELPKQQLKQLLMGYIEADGSLVHYKGCFNGAVRAVTASLDLASQLSLISNKCGILARVKEVKGHSLNNFGNTYFTISFPGSFGGWCDTLKGRAIHSTSKKRYLEDSENFYVVIKSIDKEYRDGWVHNLEVPKGNSYIAAGFATHNCIGMLEQATSSITGHLQATNYNNLFFCVSPESLIRTKNGEISILDAFNEYGDAELPIWTGRKFHQGRVYKTRVLEECETHLKNGQILKTSDEHWFYTIKSGESEPKFVNQRDLNPGDILLVSCEGYKGKGDFSRKIYSTNIPKSHINYHEWDSSNVQEDMFELLGWIAGDGHIGRQDELGREAPIQMFYHHIKELKILSRHEEILNKYGISYKVKHIPYYGKNKVKYGNHTNPRIFIHDVAFKRWVLDLGFERSGGRRIAPILFTLPESYRQAFLRGLFSADGHTIKNPNGYGTPSLAIVDQYDRSDVVSLLLSLGVRSTLMKNYNKKNLNPYIGIRIKDVNAFKSIGYIQEYKNDFDDRSQQVINRSDVVSLELSRVIAEKLLKVVDDVAIKSHLYQVRQGENKLSRLHARSLCADYGLEEFMDVLSFTHVPVLNTVKTNKMVQMYDVEILDPIHRFTLNGVLVHNTHGFASRGLLWIQGDITPSQLQSFRAMWAAQIAGNANSWRTPILAGVDNVQWVQLSANNRDMEYSNYQDHIIRTLCGLFQISPVEIGFDYLTKGSEQKSLGESNNEWKIEDSKDRGLRPIMMWIENMINTYIIPGIDPELGKKYSFSFVGLDAESKEEELVRQGQEMALHSSLNEIRKELSKDPLLAGDVPLNPIYLDFLFKTHTIGEIREKILSYKGAISDPLYSYMNDGGAFLQNRTVMVQAMNPQGGDPNDPNGGGQVDENGNPIEGGSGQVDEEGNPIENEEVSPEFRGGKEDPKLHSSLQDASEGIQQEEGQPSEEEEGQSLEGGNEQEAVDAAVVEYLKEHPELQKTLAKSESAEDTEKRLESIRAEYLRSYQLTQKKMLADILVDIKDELSDGPDKTDK